VVHFGGGKTPRGNWLERVYYRRGHSAIGMISPVEFENRLTETVQAA
jgi:putative transposase